MSSNLEAEIRIFLIETLSLEDETISELDANTPLFGNGLGLDSVDALELAVALQKKYGIKLDPKDVKTPERMSNIKNLAAFVEEFKTENLSAKKNER